MAAKTAVTAKNTAAPKGLQLTTAQQAAYNKAYKATATAARTRLALASAAKGFRKYRLQAAYATVKAYNTAHRNAQAAAIAAYATRRSWVQSRLAHQNSALKARIELDMYNHANLAGRLQYIAAGEKAYAHAAVMRTVDSAQATAYEAKAFAAVAKTAAKASKSTTPYKAGPNSAAIAAVATAAALKAAKATAPGTAAAPRTAPNPNYGNPYGHMYNMWGQPAPAPPRTPQTRRDWLGDDVTPNCVITAIANHLLYSKGVRATEADMLALYEACKPEPAIEEVLWAAYLIGWPWGRSVRLTAYYEVEHPASEQAGLVIGYTLDTEQGRKGHAALSLAKGEVVSWGGITDRESLAEEAWVLAWES